jgi:hypothetical protein
VISMGGKQSPSHTDNEISKVTSEKANLQKSIASLRTSQGQLERKNFKYIHSNISKHKLFQKKFLPKMCKTYAMKTRHVAKRNLRRKLN